MSMLRYVSHPDVDIDPTVPVTTWGLSAVGRRRVEAVLDRPWLAATARIVSSPETKAREVADLIGSHLGIPVEVRPATGEIDRTATGYVDAVEHERLADLFFSSPESSARGWERAVDAQARIVHALDDLLGVPAADEGAVVVVGHGGVGTLLLCHLAGLCVGREHDQPGQGHVWAYDRTERKVVHRWRPIDG